MKRFRLLIVDDEPLIRAGIRDGVSAREDVEVAGECGSVAEAVDALQSDEVDLVLLDVELPDGTGFELMAEMKRDYGLSGIALTGYGMEEDIEHGRNAGFAVHLTKPIVMQSLDAALEQLVR